PGNSEQSCSALRRILPAISLTGSASFVDWPFNLLKYELTHRTQSTGMHALPSPQIVTMIREAERRCKEKTRENGLFFSVFLLWRDRNVTPPRYFCGPEAIAALADPFSPVASNPSMERSSE